MEKTVRGRAVHQLLRIERDGATIADVGSDFDNAYARDRRQVREYVAGVTRWRRWLDFVLSRYYRGDYEGMEPLLRQILRLGAYELLFLETPPHAVLNEAVRLAKNLVRAGAGGLANALLRKVQRHRFELPEPEDAALAERLAVRQSHPTWMVRRWLGRYGEEATRALLAWNNSRPKYTLRVNTLRIPMEEAVERCRAAGMEVEHSRLIPVGIRVDRLQTVLQAGLIRDGSCVVQDESAMLAVQLLDPKPGETVVDLCAAPGGKSFFAAALMENHGRIIACDLQPNRLRTLTNALNALGISIVEPRVMDAAVPDPDLRGVADRVLLDAPCTGLGVLAKRADLRWKRTPEELERVVRWQGNLLDAAAGIVRPGGVLVYSTCTIEPEENERQIEAFLARHAEFTLENAGAFVPEAVVHPAGYMATLPHRHGVDGAFAARLVRVDR